MCPAAATPHTSHLPHFPPPGLQCARPLLPLTTHTSHTFPLQVFNVPGRCYPVDIVYAMEDHFKDHVSAAVDTVMQIHLEQPPGMNKCGGA